MGKLCEVIAVEKGLQGTCQKILEEATKTLKDKEAHFVGFHKRYEPFAEEEKTTESIDEHKAMDTTVRAKLLYMFESFVNYVDAVAQKEATNQVAKADLVVDGIIILEKVPATSLLTLETQLTAIRGVFEQIPTLPPGIDFEKDPQHGTDVWKRVHDDVTFRTRKEPKSKVLYDATKEHPAQIEKWSENVNIGKYITTFWYGMLSPSEKSEMLAKIDKLIRSTKQARQRANTTEVVHTNIGQKLVDYLMKIE
jgi:hypothetical protein